MADDDGKTRREKLEHHAQSTGKVAPQLSDRPMLPDYLVHVWEWFWELSSARGGNGFGPSPIPYREIEAWARLLGRDPRPWEVRLLTRLDRLYLEVTTPKAEPKCPTSQNLASK